MNKKIIKLSLYLLVIISIIGGAFCVNISYALNPITKIPDSLVTNTPSGWNNSNTGFSVNSYTANNAGTVFDVFCLEHSKNYAAGLTFSKQEVISDYGLLVIMANSYPNINFSYNGSILSEKYQKWITQTAIWYYLDQLSEDEKIKVQNATSVLEENELTSSDNIPLYTEFIKPLVDLGNSNKTAPAISLEVSISDTNLVKSNDGDYYESGLVKVTGIPEANFNDYNIIITAKENTKIFTSDGTEITNLNNISTDTKFYIRVYAKDLTDSNKNIKITVNGDFDIYEGYYYRVEGNSEAQTVSSVNTTGKTLTKELDLQINQIVEVPDTKANSYLYLGGLLLLTIGAGFIIKNKKNNN